MQRTKKDLIEHIWMIGMTKNKNENFDYFLLTKIKFWISFSFFISVLLDQERP